MLEILLPVVRQTHRKLSRKPFLRCLKDSRQMAAAPFVEDVEGPGARPRGAGVEEIVPDHLYSGGMQMRRQRRRQTRKTCFEAGAEGGAHPVFPREGEGALFLQENFGG